MITDLQQLWQEAFGDPKEFVNGFFGTGFSPERCRRLYADDRLAAALYWFDVYTQGRKLAYIYAVATAKTMRGRGYCHRLMHHAHQQLKRCGYSGAILVPGDKSLFDFYRHMGYETFCTVREFSCDAGAPISLRQLSREEYAARRKEKLPRGSVLQEGAALSFLETYASFWAGDDFVLAGSVQKDTLYVQEYLGEETLAPAITGALGAKKGLFRTPGTGRYFAMYYPLDDSPAPKYFGLALD